MMATYLNTIDDRGPDYRRSLVKRIFGIGVALVLVQPLWTQTKSPANLNVQKAQPKIAPTPAAAIAETTVPNLLWLPRESALTALRNARLQPEATDDNQPGSVVIVQPTIAGTKVPVYSKVRYSIGRPVLKLEASPHLARIHGNVHFKVILTPSATSANAPVSPVVYEFVWRRGEHSSQETTDTFVREAPQVPGLYAAMVSTTINDVPLESNSVEIKFEPIPATPTPPKPMPPVPQPNQTSLFLLVAAILGTLAAAYGFHKLKKRRAPMAKVKVLTGNRQIQAKILEPQQLKSKCLTRVRWVRGPVFSRMLPQEKIVKKKGSAHA
jgi:hypothetical protein